MKIRFGFVAEGTSDLALVPIIERLLVVAGATEAVGSAPNFARLPSPPGKGVRDQVDALLRLEPDVDAVFVHRDADSREATERRKQIVAHAGEVDAPLVPVVPVQETEAWCLLNEESIRRVAGHPRGTCRLDLPTASTVEGLANPKEKLQQALIVASELRGRRLDKFKSNFSRQRRQLLDDLDDAGPISRVPSWRQLVADVSSLLSTLQREGLHEATQPADER